MIRLPSSKSMTQRALILSALARGLSRIKEPLVCDDSQVLMTALSQLGVEYRWEGTTLCVTPPPALTSSRMTLSVGNAGTAARFLAALSLRVNGALTLDGSPRMRQRPMGGLIKALESIGGKSVFSGQPMCLPVTLYAPSSLPQGRPTIELEAFQSSQPVSGLMMVGATLPRGMAIHTLGDWPSRPYVMLTAEVMKAFGGNVEYDNNRITVLPTTYHGADYWVEGDWSSASYLFAAMMITGRFFSIDNLNAESVQGDRQIVHYLETVANGEGELTLDLRDTPDIVPTLAVFALLQQREVTFTNISHLRHKESDRLHVLARELRKVGANITEWPDGLVVRPSLLKGNVTLNPESDHRMAMAFSLLRLRLSDITILEPECVTKSYPDFWKVMEYFG